MAGRLPKEGAPGLPAPFGVAGNKDWLMAHLEHFAFKILQILKAATASFRLKGVAFRLIRRWASAFTRPPEQI